MSVQAASWKRTGGAFWRHDDRREPAPIKPVTISRCADRGPKGASAVMAMHLKVAAFRFGRLRQKTIFTQPSSTCGAPK